MFGLQVVMAKVMVQYGQILGNLNMELELALRLQLAQHGMRLLYNQITITQEL